MYKCIVNRSNVELFNCSQMCAFDVRTSNVYMTFYEFSFSPTLRTYVLAYIHAHIIHVCNEQPQSCELHAYIVEYIIAKCLWAAHTGNNCVGDAIYVPYSRLFTQGAPFADAFSIPRDGYFNLFALLHAAAYMHICSRSYISFALIFTRLFCLMN